MKKFTALMLVAVCLIVGGVYATWSYATGDITTYFTEWIHPNLVDVAGTPSLKGEIKVASNNLAISVDDRIKNGQPVAEGVAGDYVAEVYYTGSLVVTFTPAVGSDTTIIDNGLPMELVVVLVPGTYEGNAIFGIKNKAEAKTVLYSPVLTGGETSVEATQAGEIGTYEKLSDGSFKWTITGEQFATFFTFYGGNELKLDTFAKHGAFDVALAAASFQINIGEKGKVESLMTNRNN